MKWIETIKQTREKSPIIWIIIFFFGFLAVGWGLRELVIEITGQKVVAENKYVTPVASFSYEIRSDGEVKFNNLSENYKSLQWEYGDGSYGGILDTIHKFEKNGDYNVKLIATNEIGSHENIITVKISNIELAGRVFYASGKHYPIYIKIDGVSKGVLSKKYSAPPVCFDDGTQTIYLPAGNYNLTASAKDGYYTWDTRVEFTKGTCIPFGLE